MYTIRLLHQCLGGMDVLRLISSCSFKLSNIKLYTEKNICLFGTFLRHVTLLVTEILHWYQNFRNIPRGYKKNLLKFKDTRKIIKVKQSNQLSLFHQNDCKTRKDTKYKIKHRTPTNNRSNSKARIFLLVDLRTLLL